MNRWDAVRPSLIEIDDFIRTPTQASLKVRQELTGVMLFNWIAAAMLAMGTLFSVGLVWNLAAYVFKSLGYLPVRERGGQP